MKRYLNLKICMSLIAVSLIGFTGVFANHANALEIEKNTSNEGQVVSVEVRYGLNQTDTCISGHAQKSIHYPSEGLAHVDVELLKGQQVIATRTTGLYPILSRSVALRLKRRAYKACFTADEIAQASKARVTYHAHPHNDCGHGSVGK